MQTMLIQDDVVEGMKILYRDLRGTDSFSNLIKIMNSFLESMRKYGVNIQTKLIEMIHEKIQTFTSFGRNDTVADDLKQ
jgi:hypothetical protein